MAAWVFQSNPCRFRIDEALRALPEDDWEIRQHPWSVHAGDRVYVWRAGPDAGIVACGRVIEEPAVRPPVLGTEFWVDPWEGERIELRARVRYERLVEPPILRRDLRYHPLLRDLPVIRRPLGTVFPVSEAQAAEIERWLLAGAPDIACP